MASVLEFVGPVFRDLPPGAIAVKLIIQSDFPTVANAGVRLLKDNGDGTISQVGQGIMIDTSIETPQLDSVLLALRGPGIYAVAFQGTAINIHGGAVKVGFSLCTETDEVLEDFGGMRGSDAGVESINGSAFLKLPAPGARA